MTAPAQVDRIGPGLWSWARRHPEWHPGTFGAEVVSFMAEGERETLLIDPLLEAEDPAWDLIAAAAPGPLRILVTIPYHVRSAEPIRNRFAAQREVTIHGHPAAAKRLTSTASFEPFTAGDELPAGIRAHPIGSPRRFETPLLVPGHDALIFGDAIAGTGAGPRIWSERPIDRRVARFYSERFVPTLLPLLDLSFERLLLTHGPSVLREGRMGLREAIEAPPWYHRPG